MTNKNTRHNIIHDVNTLYKMLMYGRKYFSGEGANGILSC